MEFSRAKIQTKDIVYNRGQLDGLPANPRFIRTEAYEILKESIRQNPEMMALRELIVYCFGDKYLLIGGEMRCRSIIELKWKEADAIIISKADVQELKAIVIKDNSHFGEWNVDGLVNEWNVDDAVSWGLDIWIPGSINYDEIDLDMGGVSDGDMARKAAENSLKTITLFFDQEQHRKTLEKLAIISEKMGIENDNSRVVLNLLEFYEKRK